LIPFELIVDAAAREIREGLGIIIMPTALLCVVDQVDRAERQHWIAPVFRIEEYEGTPAIMEPDALSDLGWFKLDALPSPLTEATKFADDPRPAEPLGEAAPSPGAASRQP
jgi:ADP-ribose pyrophosphatase YjhB (NUDIX family)